MDKKRKYRKPTVKIVSLKTKESVLQTCRAGRETNPFGPCNQSSAGGDCEVTHHGDLDTKCFNKVDFAS